MGNTYRLTCNSNMLKSVILLRCVLRIERYITDTDVSIDISDVILYSRGKSLAHSEAADEHGTVAPTANE